MERHPGTIVAPFNHCKSRQARADAHGEGDHYGVDIRGWKTGACEFVDMAMVGGLVSLHSLYQRGGDRETKGSELLRQFINMKALPGNVRRDGTMGAACISGKSAKTKDDLHDAAVIAIAKFADIVRMIMDEINNDGQVLGNVLGTPERSGLRMLVGLLGNSNFVI